MDMKTFSGIEFASEHNGTDVFRVIELAYEQGRKDGHSEQLGTNLAEVGTEAISRQAAIDALDEIEAEVADGYGYQYAKWREYFVEMPSAQPERVWHPVEKPPAHHKDVIVRGVEAIGNVTVHKVMQWDVDTWRPTNYAPSIMWTEWSEI